MPTILETDRLHLCHLAFSDASFILELVNDPMWLEFIGDKGVRTLEDARNYILKGPMDSYERLGFGLYVCRLKDNGIPIGICGFLKRDSLLDVDIGFAFLPDFRKQGFAFEAASAVLTYGRSKLGIDRIVAVTAPNNQHSIQLLEKLGYCFDKMVQFTSGGEESKLWVPCTPTEKLK